MFPPCLVIIQSCYFDYRINKYFICSRCEICFLLCSFSLQVLRAQRIVGFFRGVGQKPVEHQIFKKPENKIQLCGNQSTHASLPYICLLVFIIVFMHVQRFALESQRSLDLHAHLTNVTCPNKLQALICKVAVKRTRRKWTKLTASLRNWNSLTNFGSVAKRIQVGC